MTAMPAASAAAMIAAGSNISVLPASMARQVAPALLHGLDGGDADDGDVEAHVLIGLSDLHDGQRTAERCGLGRRISASSVRKSAPARSMVASVPSMASTATQACAAMTTVWPRS